MINLDGYVRTGKTIKLGGKDFVFKPLRMRDFALMRARVVKQHKEESKERRAERIAEAKELDSNIPSLDLLKHLDQQLTESEIEDMMFGEEGVTYAAYLSLKQEYPDISEEEVAALLTLEDVSAITEIFRIGEEEPTVSVDMKALSHSFQLKDGRTLNLSQLIEEAQSKKKRKRQPVEKK